VARRQICADRAVSVARRVGLHEARVTDVGDGNAGGFRWRGLRRRSAFRAFYRDPLDGMQFVPTGLKDFLGL
jgi:hypothetical protein